jgi:hypothetical protein
MTLRQDRPRLLAGLCFLAALAAPADALAASTSTPNATAVPATTTPTAPAAGGAVAPSTGAATTTPAPATPATPTTPPASTTTPAPATAPSAAAPAGTVKPTAARAHGSSRLSTAAIALAVLGGLIALGCVAWAIARMQAYEPRWAQSLRHALAEGGFRASATWAEFTDWARLGR